MALPLRHKAFIVISLVLIGTSFFAGYGFGFEAGAKKVGNYVISTVFLLQERGLIEVKINEQFLRAAIFQYENRVSGCLFIDNKTLI